MFYARVTAYFRLRSRAHKWSKVSIYIQHSLRNWISLNVFIKELFITNAQYLRCNGQEAHENMWMILDPLLLADIPVPAQCCARRHLGKVLEMGTDSRSYLASSRPSFLSCVSCIFSCLRDAFPSEAKGATLLYRWIGWILHHLQSTSTMHIEVKIAV